MGLALQHSLPEGTDTERDREERPAKVLPFGLTRRSAPLSPTGITAESVSDAITLLRRAAGTVEASEARAEEIEARSRQLLKRAQEELAKCEARVEAAQQMARLAEARARASEARAEQTDRWLEHIYSTIVDLFASREA